MKLLWLGECGWQPQWVIHAHPDAYCCQMMLHASDAKHICHLGLVQQEEEGTRLNGIWAGRGRDAAVQGHSREGAESLGGARLRLQRLAAAHEAGKAAKAQEGGGGLLRGDRVRERRRIEAPVVLQCMRGGRRCHRRRRALAGWRRSRGAFLLSSRSIPGHLQARSPV